jgi:hypothetical protein
MAHQMKSGLYKINYVRNNSYTTYCRIYHGYLSTVKRMATYHIKYHDIIQCWIEELSEQPIYSIPVDVEKIKGAK